MPCGSLNRGECDQRPSAQRAMSFEVEGREGLETSVAVDDVTSDFANPLAAEPVQSPPPACPANTPASISIARANRQLGSALLAPARAGCRCRVLNAAPLLATTGGSSEERQREK